MSNILLWAILGIALMIAEMFLPGVSLFWIGSAALLTAGALWLLPELQGIAVQFGLFAGLALAMVAIGYLLRRFWQRAHPEGAGLNRKADRKIGRVYELETAIVNGKGRAKVGDSSWMVRGPDLAAGSAVRVVATDGAVLVVEAVSGD